MDLKSINLPSKLKKRGRPKNADLKAIVLPRKKEVQYEAIKIFKETLSGTG